MIDETSLLGDGRASLISKMTHPEAQVLKFAFIVVVKIGRREEISRREAKILVFRIKAMAKRKLL